jgi:hypothetical protein
MGRDRWRLASASPISGLRTSVFPSVDGCGDGRTGDIGLHFGGPPR